MKAVIVAEDKYVVQKLAERLNDLFENKVSFSGISLQGDLIGNVKEAAPELLLTLDLAGFDRVTLTDNIAYNLLDCKQLHVLCSEELKNEKSLEKALSIAMFFACSGAEQYDELRERYPNIPWIVRMEEWNKQEEIYADKNVVEIAKTLKTVMRECNLELLWKVRGK